MSRPRLLVPVIVITLVTLTLSGVDLLREPGPLLMTDILLELSEKLVFVGAMVAVAWAMQDLRVQQSALAETVARSTAEGQAWRAGRSAEIAALGQAITDQFRAWNLTEAEADIAGLMLKGATLKDIAAARNTVEATIRQQAQAIYRKSGLAGRAELSAYFLESLFEAAEGIRARPALTVIGGPSDRK